MLFVLYFSVPSDAYWTSYVTEHEKVEQWSKVKALKVGVWRSSLTDLLKPHRPSLLIGQGKRSWWGPPSTPRGPRMEQDFGRGGAGHYLPWPSNWMLPSLSVGVSRTGLTNPSNSESSLSSACTPLTKSFSHSSPVESSEAEGGPLWAGRAPGLRAARRMSSSVRDRSHAGMERFIPAKVKERSSSCLTLPLW